jgi:hypothetical protein
VGLGHNRFSFGSSLNLNGIQTEIVSGSNPDLGTPALGAGKQFVIQAIGGLAVLTNQFGGNPVEMQNGAFTKSSATDGLPAELD